MDETPPHGIPRTWDDVYEDEEEAERQRLVTGADEEIILTPAETALAYQRIMEGEQTALEMAQSILTSDLPPRNGRFNLLHLTFKVYAPCTMDDATAQALAEWLERVASVGFGAIREVIIEECGTIPLTFEVSL